VSRLRKRRQAFGERGAWRIDPDAFARASWIIVAARCNRVVRAFIIGIPVRLFSIRA
jgi:hypothetical protein